MAFTSSMASGRIVKLRDKSYYLPPEALGNVISKTHELSTLNAKPVTLLSDPAGNLTAKQIDELVRKLLKTDDVYSDAFTKTVVLQTLRDEGSHLLGGSPAISASEMAITETELSLVDDSSQLLPSGPYFVCDGDIHQAWRLYPDELDAFVFPVVPSDANSSSNQFEVLKALADDGVWKMVAVPSRAYYTPSAGKPLAGMRVSIKDNINLAGIKTTMTNRAYLELYGAEAKNAAFVEKLLSLGAVIVGKTRMTSFASGEEPTDQWIDFHCPFNPRGDLYQSPGGSSTGAGASLAGYPWLDVSFGTDTAGSIRVPATMNGLYGLRTSHGSTDMKGVAPACQDFDVIGLLTRDLDTLYDLLRLTHSFEEPKMLPKRILYPKELFPLDNPAQQLMIDDLVAVLENYLGVEKTGFSFEELWQKHPPQAAGGKGFVEYLDQAPFHQYYHDFYHNYAAFRTEYKDKFGRDAFVSPHVRFRWGHGSNISTEDHSEGDKRLNVYREWARSNLMNRQDDMLSDAIMVIPSGSPSPKYRDDANGPFWILTILKEMTISPSLQLPQLVLPIGQIPYESRVSGRTEYQPICGSLLGAKGSDLMLVDLANKAFRSAGWPTSVHTGRFMFTPDE